MIQHVAGIEFTENIEASLWERKCVLGPLYVVWTFPPGYINCPLSSPGPKPVSWPSDGTPAAFTQALRLHYEVLWIQHSQSGVFFASVFLFSYFHNLWSLQPLSPSHLNRWLQVPVQLGPPKAALLVFLQRCLDRVSNNFPPSWHAWQGLPKPRLISLFNLLLTYPTDLQHVPSLPWAPWAWGHYIAFLQAPPLTWDAIPQLLSR